LGGSNEEWGSLASDEQRAAWDRFDRIPEPGENPALDNFLAAKHLDHGAILRVGARLAKPTVLAFAFEGGIKYRDVVTGRRDAFLGSTFRSLKIIPAQEQPADTMILCEGETDAARLTMLYPETDVGVMPAGAKAWFASYTVQVEHYKRLLVGLDNDEAGAAGYEKIRAALPHAVRFCPPAPATDWCDLDSEPPALPDVPDRTAVLVPAADLLQLNVPEHPSWLDCAVLPLNGTAIIHGTYKSYKTWIALAMAAALAQGEAWALFESVEEPVKVAYINFEVPWAYYRERVALFAANAAEPDLFGANFLSYEPLSRPRLVAGNTDSEDRMIENLMQAEVSIAFIDPVRRAMGYADMNAENEVRRMLHFMERLTRHNITAVAMHHDNKAADKTGGGDPSGMTGSGAWAGDVDSIISISRPPGQERESSKRNVRFLLRNAPSPSARGFELHESGRVLWTPEAWYEDTDDDEELPGL